MIRRLAFSFLSLLLFHGSAFGQASYFEDFDSVGATVAGAFGPAKLLSDGWDFRNQSDPVGSSGWSQGSFFTPQAGSGYLGTDSLATGFFGGTISSWILLPVVPGQVAGDLLTVQLRRIASSNEDHVELRYSPSGGTSTGTSAEDVGDFTELLLDVSPTSTGWAPAQAILPGAGRIALRYRVAAACNFGCGSSAIGIDSLSIGEDPTPPCNLPPLPQPGETRTWSAAQGPYRVCSDLAIPVNATVLVEPGVYIEVDPGRSLSVEGTLRALGSSSAPIVISGGTSLVTPPLRVRGEATLSHVLAQARIHVDHGGSLMVADCNFAGSGQISTGSSVAGAPHGTYVQVERSGFSGGDLSVTDGTLVLRNSSFFSGAGVDVLRGYLLVDQVTIDGSGLSLSRERYTQPALLDDLSIQNNFGGPALRLSGWNFMLGSSNVLQNNAAPLELTGGLVPGSTVPATGNVANHVDVGNGGIVGTSTWPNLDVPFVARGPIVSIGSRLTIAPGARILFGPGSGLRYIATGEFRALGEPGLPVQFSALDLGQPWRGLTFFSMSGAPRLEHAIVEGATLGVNADDSFAQLDSTWLRGNTEGAVTTTFGSMRLRNSQVENNGTGLRTTSSSSMNLVGGSLPNAFMGNTTAVASGGGTIPAGGNWWGAPSGPSAPSNPSGQGDSVSGAVNFGGFLAAAPSRADSTPVVRLTRPYSPQKTGSKVHLHWEAKDDGTIVAQRVYFSEHGPRGYVQIAELAGDVRSFEWTVGVANPSSNIAPSFLKVVAVDDSGKDGFDEQPFTLPFTEDVGPASLTFLTDFSQPFTFDEEIDVSWSYTGPSGTWQLAIVADGEQAGVGYGGGTTLTSSRTVRMPYVSTDTARVRIDVLVGAGGRSLSFFSSPFTVRPDARLNDAPPTVTLIRPVGATTFAGGETVPVAWTASDDEGLGSFSVQVSTDMGRTWQTVAQDLDPAARSFAWRLPASTGVAQARVRVVAFDRRFQNSADEGTLTISPGTTSVCQPDLGLGGPGTLVQTVCGEELFSGGSTTIRLQGAPPNAIAFLGYGFTQGALPFAGGTLVPIPLAGISTLVTTAQGTVSLPVTSPGGPMTVFTQFVVVDSTQPAGFAISNAIRTEFLP